jgi:hypothetical protein
MVAATLFYIRLQVWAVLKIDRTNDLTKNDMSIKMRNINIKNRYVDRANMGAFLRGWDIQSTLDHT